MRFLIRCTSLKKILFRCYNINNNQDGNILIRRYVTVLERNPKLLVRDLLHKSALSCVYSSDNRKQFFNLEKKAELIKDVLEQKKEQLKDTEHKIRQKGGEIVRDIKNQKEISGQMFREKKQYLIKDIMETKDKVKGRFEGIVERENIYTIPNILCVTRIAMSPYLGYVILQDNYKLALGLMVFAGVTDLLDGWIARKWKNQSSKIGSFLDPLADKVLIATLFVTLTCQDLIPLSLTILIIARDAILASAAAVIRYKSVPQPKTLSRYFDATHATAQLEPTFISKVNTALQLVFVGTTLASPVFGYVDHPALQALCGFTALSTVVSALSYIVSKNTYKYLKRKT